MRLHRVLPLLLLLSTVLLGGCLNSPELRGIAVQLTDLKATPKADGTVELAATIRYINENLVAIAVSETEHRLWLNGDLVARIESEKAVGLPQMADATQTLTVPVNAATASRLRALQAAGTANYRLESELLIRAAADEMKSKANGSGSVDLAGLGL